MPRKKGKNNVIQDFTINDSANAPKPVRVIRKSVPTPETMTESSWENIQDDTEIKEEIAEDGTKKLVYSSNKAENETQDVSEGVEYPEIVFYLISQHLKPEDVGRFACINKTAHAVTQKRSFWMSLFKRYCEGHPKLPEKLKADSLKAYGLRQTVIRSFYYTYDLFVEQIARNDTKPHQLVSRICVNMWFCKGLTNWNVYFKLKKPQTPLPNEKRNFFQEMTRVDMNPEENTQMLLVTCKSFQDLPPLMGMTLTKVSMVLSHCYRAHRLHLGFNSSRYPVKGLQPEREIVLHAVIGALVCDWWHPQYPYSGTFAKPIHSPPLLDKDFFEDDGYY